MQQFDTLNRQQQPFIQSGYGALGKLNTLLGLGSRPRPAGGPAPMPMGAGGGMSRDHMFRPMISSPKSPPMNAAVGGAPGGGNLRLKQLLMLRARNGDTEAARMIGMI